ncbi:MAG: hypothetical protein V3V97_01670, partial [Hyphomicrobiaceae bacterium]
TNAVQAGVGNGPDGVHYGAGWRLATTGSNIGPICQPHYVAHRIPPQQKSRAASPQIFGTALDPHFGYISDPADAECGPLAQPDGRLGLMVRSGDDERSVWLRAFDGGP